MMMKRALSPEEVTVMERGAWVDPKQRHGGSQFIIIVLSRSHYPGLAKKVYEHHHHRQLPAVEMIF